MPGVYLMRGANGDILYVGKAKNLRNRLNSYKNARPHSVSRKVLRMLRLTHLVEMRVCASETEALLAENQLLREHRPPFNVVNTHPETYYFITIEITGIDDSRAFVRFRLTTESVDEVVDDEGGANRPKRFGVFKGRGRTRDAFGALLRVLAALDAKDEGFYFPGVLLKYRPPRLHGLNVPRELLAPLSAFLHGRSSAFLERLVFLLLGNEVIPRFIHHVISHDLKTLAEFYRFGPARVRKLKRLHGIRRRVIGQEEIDDLLVLSRES